MSPRSIHTHTQTGSWGLLRVNPFQRSTGTIREEASSQNYKHLPHSRSGISHPHQPPGEKNAVRSQLPFGPLHETRSLAEARPGVLSLSTGRFRLPFFHLHPFHFYSSLQSATQALSGGKWKAQYKKKSSSQFKTKLRRKNSELICIFLEQDSFPVVPNVFLVCLLRHPFSWPVGAPVLYLKGEFVWHCVMLVHNLAQAFSCFFFRAVYVVQKI